jgi:hypothetical protein
MGNGLIIGLCRATCCRGFAWNPTRFNRLYGAYHAAFRPAQDGKRLLRSWRGCDNHESWGEINKPGDDIEQHSPAPQPFHWQIGDAARAVALALWTTPLYQGKHSPAANPP